MTLQDSSIQKSVQNLLGAKDSLYMPTEDELKRELRLDDFEKLDSEEK